MIWFATLPVWPSRLVPTRVMFLPISSNSGPMRSNTTSGPPTMIVSVPAFTPTSPPETGASRQSQPGAFMRFAKSFVSIGEIELMSTTVLPFESPAATPPSANSTFATSGVPGTNVKTMSACCHDAEADES